MILSFGFYTGAMYQLEEQQIEDIAPSYEKAHDDKLAYLFAIISWLGVLGVIIPMLYNKRLPVIKYSYKNLWDKYHSNNQK